MKYIKLRRLNDNESVVINTEHIVKIRTAERGTTIVYLETASNEHVIESLEDILRSISSTIDVPVGADEVQLLTK